MKCYEHEGIDAIVNCAHCGVGLCKECEQKTAFRLEGKPLCKKCNILAAEENVAQTKNVLFSVNMKFYIWIGVLLAGILVFTYNYFTNLSEPDIFGKAIFIGILVWGLGNITSILKKKPDNRSFKTQVIDGVNELRFPIETGVGKIIGFIIGYIIVGISLPIQIVILFFTKKKVEKQHKENIDILNSLK